MTDPDELDILIEYDGETYLKGIRVSDGWVRSPYEVHFDNGRVLSRDDYQMARALAILATTYDDIDFGLDNSVPIPVALDGAPAIASYLHGVQQRPRSEIADIMNVSEKTVLKYINRLDPHRRA
ncbi:MULTISPECIES: hypothetical protein [Halorubrum]|uniref:hypothetical protein n=1 Tax=Halorubrum TaxID=56688 RepID=UPI0011C36694|nr:MULTISPECIES: hypothetical protein [Halorubrum]MDB9299425.1 hypothetical protein [Halorubrum ezzemoulense]